MKTQKIRHGCVTKWLILAIVINLVVTVIYVFTFPIIKNAAYSPIPDWAIPIYILSGIFNIVFLVAIFSWKKWGFWGFLATSILLFFVNLLVGVGIIQSILGPLGVAILFGILQMGKEYNGWSQLD